MVKAMYTPYMDGVMVKAMHAHTWSGPILYIYIYVYNGPNLTPFVWSQPYALYGLGHIPRVWPTQDVGFLYDNHLIFWI